MIHRDATPIGHRPVYKRVDLGARKPRKAVITYDDILAGERVDEDFYEYDYWLGVWRLKP